LRNAAGLDQLYRQRAETVPSLNAVQNMESFAHIQAQQATDTQRLLPAFRSLYSELTPQQQEVADRVFRANAERGEARLSQR
jgi:hypothetical protein